MAFDRDSFAFRALLLTSLIWMAVGFAFLGQEEKPAHQQEQSGSPPGAKEVSAPKSLWARTVEDAPSFWTAVLAGLTVVLAGVGVGQMYYLRRTDETARISAKAAEKAALAAEKSALVAESALVGAEAPFIFAKALKWREGDPLAPGNRPGFAAITLHNHGRSPAIVRDFYVGPIKCVGMPGPVSYPPPHSALHRDDVIPAGQESDPWRFAEPAFHRPDGGDTDPHSAYWIIGQVRYADAFGAQYVTGFCFFLNAFSGKFYGSGGSRYNYRRRLSEEETREAEVSDAELPLERPRRPSLREQNATHDTPPRTEP